MKVQTILMIQLGLIILLLSVIMTEIGIYQFNNPKVIKETNWAACEAYADMVVIISDKEFQNVMDIMSGEDPLQFSKDVRLTYNLSQRCIE